MRRYFYSPRDKVCVDVALPDGSGTLRTQVNQRTLQETRAFREDDSIVVVDEETLLASQRARFIRPVTRSSREEFRELMDVLPPMGWASTGDTESFKLCEFTYADLTTICCRVKDEFFILTDSATLKHEEIVRKVLASGLRAH